MTEEFYGGQIFEGEYPPEAADWCNENGCYVEEIESAEEGARRFEIKEVPPETEEEKKARRALRIKAQLNAIDLKSIRALRAGETEYLQQYEAQAIELRQQLKELGVSDECELN